MSDFIFLNKTVQPSEGEMLEALGQAASLWSGIHTYINEQYDFTPELTFFTKKYGWTIRYRRSGKTLCYFFPGRDAFSILIVLGKKEVEKAEAVKEKLNEKVRLVLEETEQLHDGRWLWIKVTGAGDIASFKLILGAKRKPKNQ